jgi:Rhodopirellula transposase DDE domain
VSYVPEKTSEWIRRPGGGRKKAVELALCKVIWKVSSNRSLVVIRSPRSGGTCQSLRQLAAQLTALGHPVSHTLVGELLRKMGYSLQANQKTKEGATHPDRNAQFKFINARTKKELAAGNPVISVDTKKKELVGDFKNRG